MFSLSVTCNDTRGKCLAVWLAITNIKIIYLYSTYTPHSVNIDTVSFTFTAPVLHTIYVYFSLCYQTKMLHLDCPLDG